MSGENNKPSILTNMAFWQSRAWSAATTSIYPMDGRTADPIFLPWWREAWTLFRMRAKFDVVVTMGARESLTYGLLCAITGLRSNQIFSEVFIDDAKPASLVWRLKTAALRLIAQRAIGVLTNSSMEIETNAARFAIPREKLRFVPMHGNIPHIEPSALDEGYVLSAGRTLRDYATLLAAAHQIPRRILVICGNGDLHGMKTPVNVEILREIPRENYLEKLRRCTLVALPLLRTDRSTGQVVMLEAMACGKPVVTTRSPGTVDVLHNGENGILVPPCDADALADAVNKLLNREDLAHALASHALEDLAQLYTWDIHAQAKLRAISELWKADRDQAATR